jgi:hypothetical protein
LIFDAIPPFNSLLKYLFGEIFSLFRLSFVFWVTLPPSFKPPT